MKKQYGFIVMTAALCLLMTACGETEALNAQNPPEPAESIAVRTETVQETEDTAVPVSQNNDIVPVPPGCCELG